MRANCPPKTPQPGRMFSYESEGRTSGSLVALLNFPKSILFYFSRLLTFFLLVSNPAPQSSHLPDCFASGFTETTETVRNENPHSCSSEFPIHCPPIWRCVLPALPSATPENCWYSYSRLLSPVENFVPYVALYCLSIFTSR